MLSGDHSEKLRLVQDLHAQLLRLLELGPRIGSRNDVVRLPADTLRGIAPEIPDPLLRVVAAHGRQSSRQNEDLARKLAGLSDLRFAQNLHAGLLQTLEEPDIAGLMEPRGDAFGDLRPDVRRGLQIFERQRLEGLEDAADADMPARRGKCEVPRERDRRLLTDMQNAQRIEESREGHLPLFRRLGNDVLRRSLAEPRQGRDVALRQREDIGRIGYQPLVKEPVDDLRSESLDIERSAGYEMIERFPMLRAAGRRRTAGNGSLAHDGRAVHRTARRHPERRFFPGAEFLQHARDLRNDVSRTGDDDGVADPKSEPPDLVRVVKRCVRDRRAPRHSPAA